MIKGCKENFFFINQIFVENIRRLHQGKKFFGKKIYFFFSPKIKLGIAIIICWNVVFQQKNVFFCAEILFFPDEDVWYFRRKFG